MIEHKKLILYFTLYLIVFQAIDLKSLKHKKKPVKGKVKSSDHERTTTIGNDTTQDDNKPVSTENDDSSQESEETEEPTTQPPAEEPSESEKESNDESSEGEFENDSSDDSSENGDEAHRGKITKEEIGAADEPDVTHVYGDGDDEETEATTTYQPPPRPHPTSTTRKPSNMVPTGSWTLACPNPCSQSCAPSCTPQCCEGHFSMTAPVPMSDEPPLMSNPQMNPPMNPPMNPSMNPPMNPQMNPPMGGMAGANMNPPINPNPSQCPSYCNNNPSCSSMCDPSCCSMQSLKTFLDTAAGILNSAQACSAQCTDPNCNSNPACPPGCCSPSSSSPDQNALMVSQTVMQPPPSTQDLTAMCPPECASYGANCNAMCRSECCPKPDKNSAEASDISKSVNNTQTLPSSAKYEEMEQAIARGLTKCPDYCNSTECLSKCPIICC